MAKIPGFLLSYDLGPPLNPPVSEYSRKYVPAQQREERVRGIEGAELLSLYQRRRGGEGEGPK
jgi:hypothetical protein